MASPIISLEHIDYYYDRGSTAEVHALKDVTIEVGKGEYVAFFGPSGCGKSTLLYLIAGIERPTAGKVIVDGKDIAKLSETDIALYRQSGVGIIFQNFNLIPSISVLENIAMPLAFLGIPPAEREKRARAIMERLGIAEFAKRYPFELSGGQQQRVGIARALANDPPIILADEPLGNLDSDNAKAVLKYLDEFHKRDGRTVVMVTHEEWSLQGAERIFHMRDGVVTKVSTQKPGAAAGVRTEVVVAGRLSAPPPEKQAHAYADFLLKGYSSEEVGRLEKFVLAWMNKDMDGKQFREALNRPFNDGGVGLWRPRAERVTDEVGRFIMQSKNLATVYRKILESGPKADIAGETLQIRDWLLLDTSARLTPEEMELAERALLSRIRRLSPPSQFPHILGMPRSFGGVGLRVNIAMRMGEKLETLLGEKAAMAAVAGGILPKTE